MASTEQPTIWLRECDQETTEKIKGDVKGPIPSWLEGRLILNGPGTLHVGDTKYQHLFDSLGLLQQFTISSSKVTYQSRFLKSDSYRKNMAANRIVVTEFGTVKNPDPNSSLFDQFKNALTIPTPDKAMTDNCSVNVCQPHDELFALTESCFIRKIDPETLDTIGDKININKYVEVNMTTPHPHIDLKDGTLYNIGTSFTNLTGPCYNVIEIPQGKLDKAKVVASIPTHRKLEPSSYHSFAMTDNHFIFVEQPLVLSLGKIIAGSLTLKCPAHSLTPLPGEATLIKVVDRSTGKVLPINYRTDSVLSYHHVNAWEEDGQIIMDLCGSSEGNIVETMWISNLKKKSDDPSRQYTDPNLMRLIFPIEGVKDAKIGDNLVKMKNTTCTAIKQKNGSIHCTTQKLVPNIFDSPRINYKRNGLAYNFVYGLNKPKKSFDFNRILKINVKTREVWTFSEENCLVGEPIYVPSPGATEEDDGVILTTLLKKSDPFYVALLILQAKDMKEISRVEFKARGVVTTYYHGKYVGVKDKIHSF